MSEDQSLEVIKVETLIRRVREMRHQNHRLVQISATRLTEGLELTYSFDLDRRLASLRVHLPETEAQVPSISSIYWCAFLYENEIHDLFGLQVEGIAVDFHGKLYQTAVKFPFGATKSPAPAKSPPAIPGTEGQPQELSTKASEAARGLAPAATP